MTQDNGAGVLDLVNVKLTEISHIDSRLLGIHHGGEAVQFDVVIMQILDCDDYVAQFAYA